MLRARVRRAAHLVEMGHARVTDGFISSPRRTVAALERQDVDRVGKEISVSSNLPAAPVATTAA